MATKRSKWVNLRTRVPAEVGEAIRAMATENYPSYRVVRDIIVSHVAGVSSGTVSTETFVVLKRTASIVGYQDVDALLRDLAAAFLRVYRYNTGALGEDESTPDEEIREMFKEMEVNYAQGLSVRKGT